VGDISVLVVDDHTLFADTLQARLAQEPGLGTVSVAYSAREAVEWVAQSCPDVVVLDVVLNHANSLDFVEDMLAASPNSKILMLTAVESVDEVVTALSRGARGWLPKTVSTDQLIWAIRGVHRGEAWLQPALLGRVLNDLTERATAPHTNPLAGLSPREYEVLQCMVDGLCRAEIAARLGVSGNTVRAHAQNLISKLGVHSTLESVALALRSGMRGSDR
jgi:DNA-binding NarL/FixJ family response regulator